MNEIVKKFLLTGDILIPEIHLRQPGFIYSVCGPFTKIKERMQNFKETGNVFIRTNKIKVVFKTTCLTEILKI